LRNAVVVFTKVPESGKTKTRLTSERGGILTPEEAKEFYEASLLDVIDCCISSACCDVYICYDAEGDASYLKKVLGFVAAPDIIKGVFPDQGGTFDKGMQYASDYILRSAERERRADAVMIVGGDMPSLQPDILREAFAKLEKLATLKKCGFSMEKESCIGPAMVVSADQECGFNLLAYTYTTPFNFDGVFYNPDGVTALDMISVKALEQNIPLGMLKIVPDIDVINDFAGFISLVKIMQISKKHDSTLLLPKRTINVLEMLGLEATAPVPFNVT